MAGGRRTAKSSAFRHNAHSADERHACEIPAPQQVTPPKHVPIPDLSMSGELCFEIEVTLFCLLCMIGQYVNLYRSVFWLPHSYSARALNFYLIDPYLLTFNLIVVLRRLPLCILKHVCFLLFPTSFHPFCVQSIKVLVIIVFIPSIIWCSFNIFMEHGSLSLICLSYPTIVYIILYGPTTTQILELKNVVPERHSTAKNKGSSKNSVFSVNHVCSMSAETVREEVELLKTDFNTRLKHVLFNSLLIAYYLSFVPCCFAPNVLYYETYWVGQHISFTWLNCFTLYLNYCFPSRYCDILHRAALHLGRWQRIDIKNMHVPYSTWSESTMWNQGALVKHAKELFKAEGIANAAEPGNSTHSRFYAVFNNPSRFLGCIALLQITITSLQLVLLVCSFDWPRLVSVQFLVLMNYKTMFKMARNFMVLKKIYKEEKALLLKFSS